MAGEKEEILKYTLDIADAEAKAAKLQALLDEMKAKRAAGQDISELEAQFAKEVDGLSKVAQHERRATDETGDLLKQKQRLAAVVRSLGGDFGGLVGSLGNVIQLLVSATPAAAGMAAALAGITFAVSAIKEYRAELERLETKLREMEQSRRKFGEGLAEPFEQIQRQLAAVGQLDPTKAGKALETMLQFRELGVPLEAATALAVPAVLAGGSVAQIDALAAAALTGRQFKTAEEVSTFYKSLRPGAQAAAAEQLEALRHTALGRAGRAEAELFRWQMRTDPTLIAMLEGSQDYILLQMARRLGILKEKAGVGRVDELRRELDDLLNKEARGELGRLDIARLDLLRPLGEASYTPDRLGIFDTTGEVQTGASAAWRARIAGARAPGYTPQVIQIFEGDRNGTVIGQNGDKRRRICVNRADLVGAPYPGLDRTPLVW